MVTLITSFSQNGKHEEAAPKSCPIIERSGYAQLPFLLPLPLLLGSSEVADLL